MPLKPHSELKYLRYEYDERENVMRAWVPGGIKFVDHQISREFFDEIMSILKSCEHPPYVLADLTGFEVPPYMSTDYANHMARMKEYTLGVFRYGIPRDMGGELLSTTMHIAAMKAISRSNLYPDEKTARAAIREAKKASGAG